MVLSFLPTSVDELPELAEFLTAAFGLPAGMPFVERRLLEWKCFAPHPYWGIPRSYVLKQDGKLAAHGCAHPASFVTEQGEVTGTRVIDWGGSPAVRGAGVLLFRKFATFAATLTAVGGSEETRTILPKIGFRQVGSLSKYARPVRPFRQFVRRHAKDWRSAARFARNVAWSRAPLAAVSGGLSAVRVERFEGVPVAAPSPELTPARRSPELLNYMLACPGAAFSGFVIQEASQTRGYFVLSRVGGQTRIADIWTEGDWAAAFSLAAREAMRDPETCEVAAVASVDRLRNAILANSFQPRGADPVLLYDPKGLLANAPPLHLQLLDGDECYLSNPDYQFWT